MPMRLARYLSQAGVASRRKAEELILEGRVQVDGKVVTNVATNVDENRQRVSVDGSGIALEDHVYVVLNKPKGCVSTTSDPEGRPTVMDYLPNLSAAVKPVGRLDFHSEGVLLLTNDGELAAALLAPKTHVEKTYHVKVRGQLRDKDIDVLRTGVRLDDGYVTQPAQVDRLKGESKHDWLVITLREGKNRQIHRMLEALNHQVSKIQRVAFGTLTFHGLRVGDARELDAGEVKELRKLVSLGANPRVGARGKWKAKREDTDRARRARAKAREEAQALASGESNDANAPRTAAKPERKSPPRKPAPRGRSGARTRGAADGGRGGSGGRKGGPAPRKSGPSASAGRARSGGGGKPTRGPAGPGRGGSSRKAPARSGSAARKSSGPARPAGGRKGGPGKRRR